MDPSNRALILDTSAVLSGVPPPPGVRLVTAVAIEQELRPGGRTGRAFEALLARGLELRAPSPAAARRAADAARATGDVAKLSAADLDLVGVALDLAAEGGVLVTDDYAIQNVARRLGLPWEGLAQPGTREEWRWRLRCTGCGRWFDEAPPQPPSGRARGGSGRSADPPPPACPVCGAELRAKRDPKRRPAADAGPERGSATTP